MLGLQAIAYVADRFNDMSVIAQLLSQCTDLHIYRSGFAHIFRVPYAGQKLLPGKGRARLGKEEVKQFVLFIGKGDFLIAGYNTASEEEKEQYHAKRIRIVLGTCFLLLAVLTTLRNVIGTAAMFIGIGIVLVATLTLANTWTKK